MAGSLLNNNYTKTFGLNIIRRLIATNTVRYADTSADDKSKRELAKLSKYTAKKNVAYELLDPEIKKHIELCESIKLEITEPNDISLVSGIPEEHIKQRRVRIAQPTKNAMQSATNNTRVWRLDFENRERWENPEMGWTSTGDPLSNLNVSFSTAEEAAEFCEKNGWYYEIEEPMPRKNLKKSYADNFSWDKRTRVGTK